jgi:hypothetical protein
VNTPATKSRVDAFSFSRLDTLVRVEEADGAVVIRASRDTFSDLHRGAGLLLVAQGRSAVRRSAPRYRAEVRVDRLQQSLAVRQTGGMAVIDRGQPSPPDPSRGAPGIPPGKIELTKIGSGCRGVPAGLAADDDRFPRGPDRIVGCGTGRGLDLFFMSFADHLIRANDALELCFRHAASHLPHVRDRVPFGARFTPREPDHLPSVECQPTHLDPAL